MYSDANVNLLLNPHNLRKYT